ncbi:MAG TPA: hypothetical protein VGT02_13185 [Methylomirabilota bacterium]|jgi:hypothetical protein|nr:hypothetical protein [Methylomirabilota bacterium]
MARVPRYERYDCGCEYDHGERVYVALCGDYREHKGRPAIAVKSETGPAASDPRDARPARGTSEGD